MTLDCGDHGGTNRHDEPCGKPEGWGTEFDSGKCRHHRGTSPDGSSHEGNQNARQHGIHATPEYLLEDLSERHLDTYHATFEALCTRYADIHGYDPDFAAKKRLSRVAVEIVKEDLVDEYLRNQADDPEEVLVETQIIGQDPETGRPIEVETPNKLLPQLTQLKRETRLTLKDMGLLEDPDSKQAEATQGIISMLAEAMSDVNN